MSQQPMQSWAPETAYDSTEGLQTEFGFADAFTPDTKKKPMAVSTIYVAGGSLLLLMIAIVPVWNAAALLEDFNYTFWAGPRVPRMMIIASFMVIFVFICAASVFFRRGQSSVQTNENIMNIATVFITLFGLLMLIASLPLVRQADYTTTNLMYNCQGADETHRVYEYSRVLQNIRATPDCAKQLSVETCAGYEESYPYTQYLKNLETHFHCAGFCAPKTVADKPATDMKTATKSSEKASLLSRVQSVDEALADTATQASLKYPPTLFSDANYQASCEGMAARDMQNFAGDIGHQTFFQGLYLVLIAVVSGFLKLLGFCLRKRSEKM